MRELRPFVLERYFAEYEFKVKYLLSASDCESVSLAELLSLASEATRARWERLSLGYTESQGDPALRAVISQQYARVTPEGVVVLVPEEGIFIAMHTLVEPGDEVVAIAPAYQSLYELARWRGCTVKPWPVRLAQDQTHWTLDLDELASAITPRTRLLVINFPHNPTGYLPSRSELDAIVELARRHNLYLFSDEMYRGLEYDPAQRLPAIADVYERGISLSGLSKSYALPGLRVGWLATQLLEMVERWVAFKDYTTICHSAPSEVLALMALQAADRLLRRNLTIVQSNLQSAAGFFERQGSRFRWLPPRAGSVAFPLFHGDVEAFSRAVLDHAGIMVVPGSLFDAPGQHFRLGLGRRNLPQALERVEHFLATTGG